MKYLHVQSSLSLILVVVAASTAQEIYQVPCPVGQSICECPSSAEVCEFTLTVNYLQTFASYSVRDDGTIDPLDGYIYNIDDSGQVVPVADPCPGSQCSPPQTVDGKTFRTFNAINGLTPAPTLIVTHQQTLIINVRNHHPTEAVTIHWHGMHQYNTPWMDGVPFVSQCPIQPEDSFRYIFKADPSGTFWYHGHVGASRADGMYGALVIRERDNDSDYQDLPQEHTMVIADWWKQPYSDLFTLQHTVLETYYPSSVGDLPQPGDKYDITVSYDSAEAGPVPYFSSLINGRGHYEGVELSRVALSAFNVEGGKKYRFRAVGAQSIYPCRLSIDNHKLTLVAADGYLIQPLSNLDYIILHAGERYDFIVDANQDPSQNYWIRAGTLEINVTSNTAAPFVNFNHQALAVLHYDSAPEPSGQTYGDIADNPPNCVSQGCLAVNCPFERFHESYNIACLHPAQDFRLLNPTPADLLPDSEPDEGQEYFFNFGYEGEAELSANINGRLYQSPTFSLSTQREDREKEGSINLCPSAPYTCFDGCECTQILNLPFSKTIRFVLTSIGEQTHPIHLHGHSFWVLDSGYGYYNASTGFIEKSTNALSCLENQSDLNNTNNVPCTTITWRDGYRPSLTVDSTTPRRDTILVPAGSYVVIQFRSTNPGFWFFHCHIQEHLLEGMAMIVAVDPDRQNPPPDGLHTCGNFAWTLEEFNDKLAYDPNNPDDSLGNNDEYCQCLSRAELVIVIVFSILGFLLLVVIPCLCMTVLCCQYCRQKQEKGRFVPLKTITDATESDTRYSPLRED